MRWKIVLKTSDDFNVVIPAVDWDEEDQRLVRDIVMDGEPYIEMERATTVWDVLFAAGIFKSKNEARRNWRRGELRQGMNDWKNVGKLRRRIFVLKMPEKLREVSA